VDQDLHQGFYYPYYSLEASINPNTHPITQLGNIVIDNSTVGRRAAIDQYAEDLGFEIEGRYLASAVENTSTSTESRKPKAESRKQKAEIKVKGPSS
jgi:hypothetical protein